MPTTITDHLDDLRATSLDERDKGDKFERLIASYLRTDPEWTARFSDVWLWSEWPERAGRPDTGIDLVARHRETDDYAAIQCKFYNSDRRIAKGDIDSFVATSSKAEFSARYIIDTAKGWSQNATDTLDGLSVPVQRIDIRYLDDANIDWAQFSWSTPEVVISAEKKSLRPHQRKALDAVREGFQARDRGKLIMACGTGKTYTSLKITEDQVGAGGTVLFLVPSIQLLSQTLREWTANSEVPIRPFAVCSDVRVGRKTVENDEAGMSSTDLTEPATTDPTKLATRMQSAANADSQMTVVFATYQSIEVVAKAQQRGAPEFDLVVCDEAHRTTGVTLAGDDESAFVRVHDNDFLKAGRRLYMTATPRVFGDEARRRADDSDAVLTDMNDDTVYGPEFHRLGFAEAVEEDLLTDYKVLVLGVNEDKIAANLQQAMSENGQLKLDDAAKLIGCWRGLSKYFSDDERVTDWSPMSTAVAFARDRDASKLAADSFPMIVDRVLEADDQGTDGRDQLRIEAQHVDGTMRIHTRNEKLAWLKAEPQPDLCRILTNARCLSEGVDVPSLDAVLFLTPRSSQVDVVQSVGRVMRKAPGKELGYIILPIVVPSGIAPEDAIRDNERYRVVWQVLQALRSHDDRFHALVNSIELNKGKTNRLVIDDVTPEFGEAGDGDERGATSHQLTFDYDFDAFRDAMYARIVQKVGERKYWETWARDVAEIAHTHITRINGLLTDKSSPQAREFEEFLTGLRGNLNDSITETQAVEMLAQHLITRPIFEALFTGYDFAANNPVAQSMERMLATLDETNVAAESDTLAGFYRSVQRRVEGVTEADGKQRIIVELYDKFFATAFKKTVDKLGIVYTPVEIVDFILRSAEEVLRAEFGQGLTDEGVHILDGFTGTGTFIVRLLQSGLITPHDLVRKYTNELHANEILLLAYYIAAVNIETTYAELTGDPQGFPGLILTDTFQSWEGDDTLDLDVFPENNARLERLKHLPITVIVGNPPYSVGQDSGNDNNQNEKYPSLDEEIQVSYVQRSSAGLSRNLYDSYVRAIKWATLRIEQGAGRGVIAYVTNGGWLDSNSADGMRKTLVEEFSSIHIYNLRGNQRTSGEQSRKEGGKIFGGGSRATVAVTVLVKNPEKSGPATIYYTDIGDYLTREQKLAKVAEASSLAGLDTSAITPNEHGDWLNQRREDFSSFISLNAAKQTSGVFATGGYGLVTSRDVWAYGFNPSTVEQKMRHLIENYEVERAAGHDEPADHDPSKVGWSRGLRNRLKRGEPISFQTEAVREAMYRPFSRQRVYLDHQVNETIGPAAREFPGSAENQGFVVPGVSSHAPPSAYMVASVPDMHVLDTGQFFPRWHYEPVEAENGTLGLETGNDYAEVIDGYRKLDNITDAALKQFKGAYPGQHVTKDDIFFYVYGLLHSPEYRETYAADLKKSLPRIPFVRDFTGYAKAGRKLSELHVGYESVEPYPLDGLDVAPTGDTYEFFAVGSKKMKWGKPTPEQKAAGEKQDKSALHYNDRIVLRGIPNEAHRYMLSSRSAIEWIIDRYYIKTDKTSGIVNDPNDWSREVGNPRYILDLAARVVTVSVETMKIVDALPPLEVIGPVATTA